MPGFNAQGVPQMAKIAVVLPLEVLIAPVVPGVVHMPTLPHLLFGILSETIVGVVMGMTVYMVFTSITISGEIISHKVGHAAAHMFDPLLKTTEGPLSSIASVLALAVFLGANLHLKLLLVLCESFQVLIPGTSFNPLNSAIIWVPLMGQVLALGLQLAGPILLLCFMSNVFIAVLTRLAPQMNVYFSIGMLLTLIGGIVLMGIYIPYLLEIHLYAVDSSLDLIPSILRAMTVE
jgi:flagellar biosynthetic protein FliR